MTFLLMAVAWAVAILARVEDLPRWRANPTRAFLPDGRPVLIDFDGYHYLRYADELAKGEYTSVDPYRSVPEVVHRPTVPPFLSILIAGVIKVTGAAPEWVGAIIPVVVASLFVVPVFLLSTSFVGCWWGFAAACVAALSPGFVGRSQFARLDTDGGNVLLLSLATWLAHECACRPWRQRVAWLLALALTWGLWLWWWDTARLIVSGVCMGLLAGALLRDIERKWRRWVFLAAGAMLALVVIMVVVRPHLYPFSILAELWKNVTNASDVISEEKRLGWPALAGALAGSRIGLVMTVGGLMLIALLERARALPLCVPVALAVLPFVWYERFSIFGAPVVGLGVGYFACAYSTWKLSPSTANEGRKRVQRVMAAGLVAGVMGCEVHTLRITTNWPVLSPSAVVGMQQAKDLTPTDAVIWSWWDNGYPLIYNSRRGTIEDGGWLRVPQVNAMPVTTSDERLAANWMSFVATRSSYALEKANRMAGKEGVLAVLARGPIDGATWLRDHGVTNGQELVDWLFPSDKERKNVYLYLNHLYLPMAYWWYWYGAQEALIKVEHPYVVPLLDVRQENGHIVATGGVTVEPGKGTILINGAELALGSMVVRHGTEARGHRYGGSSTLRFEWSQDERWGLLCDEGFAATVFNSLYFLPDQPHPHLKKILGNTPSFQLWQVLPDTRPAP